MKDGIPSVSTHLAHLRPFVGSLTLAAEIGFEGKKCGVTELEEIIDKLYLVEAHCPTSSKMAGSNPNEMNFFNLPNPSSSNMALGSTQPRRVAGA
jgi:hypothetical protein